MSTPCNANEKLLLEASQESEGGESKPLHEVLIAQIKEDYKPVLEEANIVLGNVLSAIQNISTTNVNNILTKLIEQSYCLNSSIAEVAEIALEVETMQEGLDEEQEGEILKVCEGYEAMLSSLLTKLDTALVQVLKIRYRSANVKSSDETIAFNRKISDEQSGVGIMLVRYNTYDGRLISVHHVFPTVTHLDSIAA